MSKCTCVNCSCPCSRRPINFSRIIVTPEERRVRAREAFVKLQNLEERYKIKLTKPYTIDSDLDEMEEEYSLHMEQIEKNNEQIEKNNKIKFYKQILLNVVCGVEFLNQKYDPFGYKLNDWGKNMADNLDDYTEVLDRLYEKYKDRVLIRLEPEEELYYRFLLSGLITHLSNSLLTPKPNLDFSDRIRTRLSDHLNQKQPESYCSRPLINPVPLFSTNQQNNNDNVFNNLLTKIKNDENFEKLMTTMQNNDHFKNMMANIVSDKNLYDKIMKVNF